MKQIYDKPWHAARPAAKQAPKLDIFTKAQPGFNWRVSP